MAPPKKSFIQVVKMPYGRKVGYGRAKTNLRRDRKVLYKSSKARFFVRESSHSTEQFLIAVYKFLKPKPLIRAHHIWFGDIALSTQANVSDCIMYNES
jgi:hypothetical protein